MTQQTVGQRLQRLRREYGAKLPARVAAMTASWRTLEQQWDAAVLESLYRDAHTLMGTAANFGFNQVGDCARELDHYLSKLRQQNQAPDGADQARIGQLFLQLRQQAETARAATDN